MKDITEYDPEGAEGLHHRLPASLKDADTEGLTSWRLLTVQRLMRVMLFDLSCQSCQICQNT